MMVLSSVLQLLVVTSTDWNAKNGNLCRYQRSADILEWELCGQPIDVSLGKNGLAWGRGHHLIQDGLQKREGDGKSPAGLFSIGDAFGDARHQKYAKNIPFLLITDDLECVDDPDSQYYNQIIRRNSIDNLDWKSSEKMKDIGPLYDIGLIIEHNIDPVESGMGSAIFMHIWRARGEGTHGCTAMQESDLNALVSWLDFKQDPYLIQLPIEEYRNKKAEWGLPNLPF